jgi:hypothetical protein
MKFMQFVTESSDIEGDGRWEGHGRDGKPDKTVEVISKYKRKSMMSYSAMLLFHIYL